MSGKTTKDPGTRAETPKEIRWDRQARSCGKDWRNFPTTSETTPKTSETLREQRTLKNGVNPSRFCTYQTQLIIQCKLISKVLIYTF